MSSPHEAANDAGTASKAEQGGDYAAALTAVIEGTISPNAAEVDRTGLYPRAGMEALSRAGLLGLMSAKEVGGQGLGLRAAADVIERISAACGSTAMVTLMHYAATAVIEAHGPEDTRRAIAAGEHLSTLAFSEAGSRSHFWAPMGTATADGAESSGGSAAVLDASKSWVTSAGEADSYVWSSRPIGDKGTMTLWLVSRDAAGLTVNGAFDGFGLRGNASSPMLAQQVPTDVMLGADGDGLDIALQTALPVFLVLNASFSLGLMESLRSEAQAHLTRTSLAHLGQRLVDLPVTRGAYARLHIQTDQVRAFLLDTLAALETQREDATLRVLEVKAVAAEGATEVADAVLRLCGGAAFRKELGVERRYRDALAARVMAPTTEALYDFVGRATCGMPLFD